MTERYAVVGNPVSHSLSPQIHTAFAKQVGADIHYGLLAAELDQFESEVEAFFEAHGAGLNVTLPFKERAFAWVAQVGNGGFDEAAQRAGAVNTLVREESGVRGCNTDGVGLLRDLSGNLEVSLRGARLLILGAGGAVRGVLGPLLDERPESLVVANRTLARAETLAAEFPGVTAEPLGKPLEQRFDVVINATSADAIAANAGALVPPATLAGGICYDLFYSLSGPTGFCAFAQESGAAVVSDGLGMLVEQAAEAFLLWRGMRPETQPVIAALRSRSTSEHHT